MPSSWFHLLSTDEKPFSILYPDRQNHHLMVCLVNVVQHPETIVRAKPQLPIRSEHRRAQGLSICGLNSRFPLQLLVNLVADQGAVLSLNGLEMFFYLWGKNQGLRLLPGHNEMYYGHLGPVSQQIEEPPRCGGAPMIANDQERAMVSRQLHELKTQRDNLLRGGNGQPFQLHVELAGLEKMIARLQEEINAYENSAPRHDATGDRDKVRGKSDPVTK
jgi:hypothetical protein